jgi:RluA family pseudouridine synthase
MPADKYIYRALPEHVGQRLDQFLAQAPSQSGPPLSRRAARRLIDAGGVFVNGKRVRVASRRLESSSRIEIYLEDKVAPTPRISDEHVLYEDDLLIAVNKPSGTPAQATQSDAVSDLFSQLRRFLADRDGPRAHYLALHHRLDRGTSGVMLFAKDRRANRGLAEAFAEGGVDKLYYAFSALSEDSVREDAWTVQNLLAPPRTVDGVRRVVTARSEAEGRSAETLLRTRRFFPGAVSIEAIPKTGRTHQIRVHLAGCALPVLGDRLYGRFVRPRIPAPRLMLHAARLTLKHPGTGKPLSIESPLPADFREYVRQLEALG